MVKKIQNHNKNVPRLTMLHHILLNKTISLEPNAAVCLLSHYSCAYKPPQLPLSTLQPSHKFCATATGANLYKT